MDPKKRLSIDLHIHSTASDGTLSPLEIVTLARQKNLGAIAVTDHDTIAGVEETRLLARTHEIDFVSGIEISADPPQGFKLSGSFHILGYGIRTDDPLLTDTLTRLQDARRDRNPKIIIRLNQLGIPITLNEIQAAAGSGQLGRPHIARIMVKKGLAASIDDAFDRYLGQGRPAYVQKFRVSCAQAIKMIRHAGGVAVLAHPILIDLPRPETLASLIKHLKGLGLQGLEVYYPQHNDDDVARFKALAISLGLCITGGTDFHGALKPDIGLGCGTGNLTISDALYQALMDRIQRSTPI